MHCLKCLKSCPWRPQNNANCSTSKNTRIFSVCCQISPGSKSIVAASTCPLPSSLYGNNGFQEVSWEWVDWIEGRSLDTAGHSPLLKHTSQSSSKLKRKILSSTLFFQRSRKKKRKGDFTITSGDKGVTVRMPLGFFKDHQNVFC